MSDIETMLLWRRSGEELDTRDRHLIAETVETELRRQREVIETWHEAHNKLERENERLRREVDVAVGLADGFQRNRDMWKGQCERQADELKKLREALVEIRDGICCGLVSLGNGQHEDPPCEQIARAALDSAA